MLITCFLVIFLLKFTHHRKLMIFIMRDFAVILQAVMNRCVMNKCRHSYSAESVYTAIFLILCLMLYDVVRSTVCS